MLSTLSVYPFTPLFHYTSILQESQHLHPRGDVASHLGVIHIDKIRPWHYVVKNPNLNWANLQIYSILSTFDARANPRLQYLEGF